MYNMFLLFISFQCIFSEEHFVTILTGKLLGQTHKPLLNSTPLLQTHKLTMCVRGWCLGLSGAVEPRTVKENWA